MKLAQASNPASWQSGVGTVLYVCVKIKLLKVPVRASCKSPEMPQAANRLCKSEYRIEADLAGMGHSVRTAD